MADRVHPTKAPAPSVASESSNGVTNPKPAPPSPEKPVPPHGTYVIQIPKDQVYRVPPPENAKRYQNYTRRKQRRGGCCCCFCWLLGLLTIFIVLIGIAGAIFYLVFRPESPNYSIDAMAIKGINLTSSTSAISISPEFDVTVRADNPNDKIGIYYDKDSSVEVYYSNVKLCDGSLPAFYQPSNNLTVFQTVLKGSGIELSSTTSKALYASQNRGNVPLKLKLRAPVKLKVGSVKTWKITVKVSCDVTADKLTANAKIVKKDCDYGVELW